MTARARLPNRRLHRPEAVECNGRAYTVGFGHEPGGPIAELFITGPKVGSEMAGILDDAAVLASILLQQGYRAGDLARRLTPDGALRTILARAGAIDAERPA